MDDLKNNDDVLTVEETMAFLKLSKQTVWRLANNGVIGRKIGGRWRFSKRQLLDYLESGSKGENENDK